MYGETTLRGMLTTGLHMPPWQEHAEKSGRKHPLNSCDRVRTVNSTPSSIAWGNTLMRTICGHSSPHNKDN